VEIKSVRNKIQYLSLNDVGQNVIIQANHVNYTSWYGKLCWIQKNDGARRYSQLLLIYSRKSNMAANDNINNFFTHHINMACMAFPTFSGWRNAMETLKKVPRSMVDQIVTTCHALQSHKPISTVIMYWNKCWLAVWIKCSTKEKMLNITCKFQGNREMLPDYLYTSVVTNPPAVDY